MTLKWPAVMITALLITHASAQARLKHHFTLSADRLAQAIVRALGKQGIETDATLITPLGNIIATEPDPSLDVRSIQSLGGRSSLRLVCHDAATCLPFYALLNTSIATSTYLHPSTYLSKTVPTVTMHVGTNATLLIDDGRTHLQMSVVSLESGPVGRTIRVRSADRQRIYFAEIVSPAILRGRF